MFAFIKSLSTATKIIAGATIVTGAAAAYSVNKDKKAQAEAEAMEFIENVAEQLNNPEI